jgi:hypothetical protein
MGHGCCSAGGFADLVGDIGARGDAMARPRHDGLKQAVAIDEGGEGWRMEDGGGEVVTVRRAADQIQCPAQTLRYSLSHLMEPAVDSHP